MYIYILYIYNIYIINLSEINLDNPINSCIHLGVSNSWVIDS